MGGDFLLVLGFFWGGDENVLKLDSGRLHNLVNVSKILELYTLKG